MAIAHMKDIFITIVLAAILLPIAFSMFYSANTTGWGSTSLIVWAVLPVVAIVVVAMKFFDKI